MNFLQRPYYCEEDNRKRWLRVLGITLFIFLFLWGFQPFEISAYSGNILHLVLGYAAVTFLVTSLFYIVLPSIFPNYFRAEDWTTGKELLHISLMLLCLGFFNLWYSSQIGILRFSWQGWLYFQSYTLAVGVFPLVFLVFFNERIKYAQHHALSDEIMQEKTPTITEATPESPITLTASNGKTVLEIAADRICYIKSEANYVEVFYRQEEALKKELIRNTLTAMETQLSVVSDFFRCHKSYLVNMQLVERVSGNAQGLKLHLSEVEQVIPVSRKHNDTLKARLLST